MAPRVLALDLAAPGGGAALLAGGETETAVLPEEVRRGRDLVVRVRDLLQRRRLAAGDLDLVACGVGPGS
ncbi:MAG: tRNA (adenosine(37)-N6)-threonylcarbamoyltransferase complex dimerization subunit type 1 TsaB, partial [Planctomycetota bacterium]